MDSDPIIPNALADKLKAGFAHQPPAELDDYVLDVAHAFKIKTPWWRTKTVAAAATILIVAGSFWTIRTLTYRKPTVLDAFAAARSMRDGNTNIKQADVDALLVAAVKVTGKFGGS